MAISSTPIILYDKADEQRLNDCACPIAPRRLTDSPRMPARVRCHPALQWLTLDSEHVVAFVPSYSRVAVLNSTARELLETLEVPHSVEHHAGEHAEALELCYRLGLLTGDEIALPPPQSETLIVWLHVTNACNLSCSYCYVDKTDEAMSRETAFASVEAALRSAQAHGYRELLLKYAGGEASLNLPLVTEIHRYALRRGAELSIRVTGGVLSNGVALTYGRLQQIRDLGLRLMISLDGMAEYQDRQRPLRGGQGSFQAVLRAIERAQELEITPDVSITITNQSVDGLPELLRWLLARDLPFSLNFYRVTDHSRSIAELQLDEQHLIAGMRMAYAAIAEHPPQRSLLGALLDRTNLSVTHQNACAVAENYLVIDHHGRVAKCQMELDRPVTDINTPDPLMLIREDQIGIQNIPVDRKEGCRTCEWRYWCAGGCSMATFRATGRYDVRSPNCAIYKALYPDVLRLEGLRILHHYRAAA